MGGALGSRWGIPRGDLPDTNVWLALAVQEHPHHAAAKRYWDGVQKDMQAAWAVYQSFRALPMIDLLPEPADCDTQIAALLLAQAALPPRLWTDAYLAALAHSSGARLVTFDRNFERFGLNRLLMLDTTS